MPFAQHTKTERIDVRAVIVHAKNEAVKQWYLRFGFEPGPVAPIQLFLLLKDIQHALR